MSSLKAFLIGFVITLLVGSAHATSVRPTFGGGGGGEIPTPFEAANQKVELADGETYLLVGKVVLESASLRGAAASADKYNPYFEIDLQEHPWLATTYRKANPYYLLDGSASYWKQFRGMRIKLTAQAHAVISYGSSGKLEYNIELRRLSDDPVQPFSD